LNTNELDPQEQPFTFALFKVASIGRSEDTGTVLDSLGAADHAEDMWNSLRELDRRASEALDRGESFPLLWLISVAMAVGFEAGKNLYRKDELAEL
jgi:hypothetical protein